LRRIYRGLSEILVRHRPDAISLEKVFLARDPQSALKLGQVRGVALLAAAENGVAVYEYSSAEIKKARR
jgi:crossover junction endodeoxyribonuclease RuvC